MSNALLAVSGPAFGNIDVTVYDVYPIMSTTSVNSAANAVTIFSGRSWSWALVDLNGYGYTIPRPFSIANSVSITNQPWVMGSTYGSTNIAISLFGTSTNLKGGINGVPWTITAYVPST